MTWSWWSFCTLPLSSFFKLPSHSCFHHRLWKPSTLSCQFYHQCGWFLICRLVSFLRWVVCLGSLFGIVGWSGYYSNLVTIGVFSWAQICLVTIRIWWLGMLGRAQVCLVTMLVILIGSNEGSWYTTVVLHTWHMLWFSGSWEVV